VSVSTPIRSEQDRIIRKFFGLQNALVSQLGVRSPLHNPYELISYRSGYHTRCIEHKVNAVVGQGYDASDALRAHIDDPNGEYPFEILLERTMRDFYFFGWMTVNVLTTPGTDTYNIWHSPSLNTRVKINAKTKELSYVRFEADPVSGTVAYTEEPEFVDGRVQANGVRMLRRYGVQTDLYYGEPCYVDVKDLLRMNWSISFAANRWFSQGLMTDYALIEKSSEERTDEEILSIRQYLREHIRGVENSHKIMYLNIDPDEDIRFEKLSSDFPAGETVKLRADNRDEIIAAHGVPPRMLGIMSAGQLGSTNEVQAQLNVFKSLVISPDQRLVEQWWQKLFEDLGFPDPRSFKLRPLVMNTDLEAMQTLGLGLQNGIITPDEARYEWNVEKSATSLINQLQQLRKELLNAGQ
jgi:hypothetical protein